MTLNHKKHILDFQSALKASAGNEQLAHKLLALFISQLAEYIKDIKIHLETNNCVKLQNCIHKLNGALQYIGSPTLRTLVSELDGYINEFSKQELNIRITNILYMLALIQQAETYPIDDFSI
jgi:HPt (histidine-containing phosphotransfer) domain-containing protein